MEWFFQARVWRKMHGLDGGETGVDNGIAEQGFAGIGAWILGTQHVRPCSRTLARRQLEGLVG